MACEEHFVEEITNRQSQGQSWHCGQTEDDVECGAQDGSAFEDFVGASLWKQMGLPFLILFSKYMKCRGKGYWEQTQLC